MKGIVRVALVAYLVGLCSSAQDQRDQIGQTYMLRERVADSVRIGDAEIASELAALARAYERKVVQLRVYSRDSPRMDSPVFINVPEEGLARIDSLVEMEKWCLIDALYIDGGVNVRRRCHEQGYRSIVTGKDPLLIRYGGGAGKIEYARFDYLEFAKGHRIDLFIVGAVLPSTDEAETLFRQFSRLFGDVTLGMWFGQTAWFPESGRFVLGFPFATADARRPSTAEGSKRKTVRCDDIAEGGVHCVHQGQLKFDPTAYSSPTRSVNPAQGDH